MDNQTQSFLELSAMNDLVQLAADKRAAWLWSADGAQILWSNAAGAAFFSVQTVSELAGLTSLERSPARPHIARIAESGLTDRFSIDRLRFYRGLRVMLLTCQCKKVELADGGTAALIVCSDKGLALTKDPIPAYAHLLRSPDRTVFLIAEGEVEERIGTLEGMPEDIDLPQGQKVLFGPLDLNEQYHDGAVLQIPAGPRIVVLSNDPIGEDQAASGSSGSEDAIAVATVAGAAALAGAQDMDAEVEHAAEEDTAAPTDEAADPVDADPLSADADTDAGLDVEEEPDHETASDHAEAPGETATLDQAPDDDAPQNNASEDEPAETEAVETDTLPDTDTEAATDDVSSEEAAAETAEEPAESEADAESFVFQPRRRPVRFAWKMDVDQRFTFLSDEFAEVLGPDATGIVGLTWADVSERFGLDPRGNIARALDRRDTWSGKTVAWPVSGAALRVPVDMAALPAFDRNRVFEGYRGFGVCRTSDAVQDPDGFVPTPVAPIVATPPVDDAEDTGDEDHNADEDLTGAVEDNTDVGDDEALQSDAGSHDADAATHEDEDSSALEADGADDDPALEDEEPERSDDDSPAGETMVVADPDVPANDDPADLKPAPPNSLGGRTFLGASAAALVGSLAMFKGKKSAETSSSGEQPLDTESPAADEIDLSDDLKSAAAALDAGLNDDDIIEDETGSDEAEDTVEEAVEELVEETDDHDSDETLAGEDLQADAEPHTAEESADGQFEDEDAHDPVEAETEDESAADGGSDADADAELEELDDVVEEASTEAVHDEAPIEENPEEEVGEDQDTLDAEEKADEPVGIAGPAELKPAEIESAVKNLAKSYKPPEPRSPDLFDEASADTPADEPLAADDTDEDDLEETAPDALIDAPETSDVVDAGDEPLAAASGDDGLPDDTDDTTAQTDEDDEAEAPSEETTPEDGSAADAEEEREFYEETAAYEEHEQAVEAEEKSTADPEPEKKTGEVIPLATARPRVVPVDTSSLSRPERQAFRKIAEALGARLEGDLEDFDAPDPEEEADDDLPPEVPEAGPIDPSLLDRLPIGISIVHDREVLYANKALLKMLGYRSISSLSQAGGLEALFIDDTDELADAVGVDGEVDEAMKVRLADGGVLNVDAHMHSVPWNGSRGLMISITERPMKNGQSTGPTSPNFFAEVRAELDNAQDQIAEMDTILETATDGVLVLDRHGTIVKVNGSAEALFSANRADMIGAPFTEFLAPESHRAASDYLDGLSRNGVASILNDGREVLGQVPAGGLIPLFMTMGRITSRDDDAKFCAVLRDITQWKTAEEELTQAKRQAENASSQKSDFLAKISHEIRTPLNAIIGFSEVMMEERFGAIGNDRYKDYLKDIRTSGSHIMSLINDLLDLSKIEAGKLDLKFTAVSTNDVINECVALMQPQANRERVIIRASLPESVPEVVADPRSLRQIVLNLLSNGIKYNKSGGQVILSTALESNGEVALRVRDTGTGMTSKQLAAALEPFRQLHTASRGGGTGLGLPLTKALVEANRASFHIDSTPDQGTLVEVVFPTQRVLSE